MNGHPSEGELRAALDREADPERAARVRAHLEGCAACREASRRISARAGWVSAWMEPLQPAAIPAATARARLAARLTDPTKENLTMWKWMTIPRYRPLWAALALVLVLGVSLAFPPVRALATNFLGVFRVQQIAAVPFDPANLPPGVQAASGSIQKLMGDSVQYEVAGKPQAAASAADASALAGFGVRLPAGAEGTPQISVDPAVHGSFKVDLPRIQAILQEMGRSDIQLPASLDKATITVDIPASVVSAYGDCKPAQVSAPNRGQSEELPPVSTGAGCTVLMQLPSPSLNAPAELDVNQLGQQFLELAGMPADQAQRFGSEINWSTTLVVPVPISDATYSDVRVDGSDGILVAPKGDEGPQQYLILWVKDGIVYALSSQGDSGAGLALANSLQ